jgi:hypothetical protein
LRSSAADWAWCQLLSAGMLPARIDPELARISL